MTQTSEIIPTTASPEPAIDFESLLAPISVEEPAGESLRYEGTYDSIEELRREDDPSLPQGVWKRKLKKAQWREVERLCHETLETRTKDLKIAAWLSEAWLHVHGFPGLEAGLELITSLCESFWDDLHPRIDDGDPSLRLAPLEWLDDHLSRAIKQRPITRPQGSDAVPYGWADWERALYYSSLLKTETPDDDAAPKDGITREKVQVSVTLTSSAFYHQLAAELEGAERALTELVRVLAEAAGDEAPSFHQVREALTAIAAFVVKVLEQRDEDVGVLSSTAELAEADDLVPLEAGSPSGPIKSRAEAYRQLSAAADYLLRTEPHSPAPYLVKRAVAWGNMPLAELFRELLQGGADLRTIYTLLGIKESPE